VSKSLSNIYIFKVGTPHYEEAVKKIRIQREMKPGKKITLPQYG
jgi:hypothetical protein